MFQGKRRGAGGRTRGSRPAVRPPVPTTPPETSGSPHAHAPQTHTRGLRCDGPCLTAPWCGRPGADSAGDRWVGALPLPPVLTSTAQLPPAGSGPTLRGGGCPSGRLWLGSHYDTGDSAQPSPMQGANSEGRAGGGGRRGPWAQPRAIRSGRLCSRQLTSHPADQRAQCPGGLGGDSGVAGTRCSCC